MRDAEDVRRRMVPRPAVVRVDAEGAAPRPAVERAGDRGGDSDGVSRGVAWEVVPDLPPGGCRLRVAGGELHADVSADLAEGGRRRAKTIIEQLTREFGPLAGWPALEVEDHPRIARRGVMLDVSRDRVPTMGALHERVAALADLGFDHLQLYTEHTFAYQAPGCAAVWDGASPVTAAEVRALDEAAQTQGIELAANQNCFGHLHRWLRTAAFADLAETHQRFDFFGAERQGPFSLCPTDPRSLTFVRERLAELMPCFSSPLVNIGCDETADVGTGGSREAVAERGKAAVERTFVAAIAGIVQASGGTPMFWADMALRDPAGLAELPPELIALAWGYEDDPRIEDAARTLAERGRRFWTCPGTSTWRSLGGRPSERRGNLRRAAAAARRHGAGGLLVTDWGDCGHRQPWTLSLHALGEAAALAWDPDDPEPGRDEAIAVHVLGQPGGELGPWLRALGDVDRALRRCGGAGDGGLHNASALFEDLHPSGLPTGLPADPGMWADVVDRLEELERAMPAITGDDRRADVAHVVATMGFAARRAAWRRDPGARRDAARQRALRERLDAVIQGHDRMWARDSRPGGAADSRRWWTDLDGAALLAPPAPPAG